MFVAAWIIDVNYGSRDEVLRIAREFDGRTREIWKSKRSRILWGSIGAPESRLVMEREFESLADLEASWDGLRKLGADTFQAMVEQMKPHIVPGSPRWEVYRIIEH
jgi:hypothetical protein